MMSETTAPIPSPTLPGEPLDSERWATLKALEDATGSGFLDEVVSLFVNDTPRRLSGLRDALAGGDAVAAERLAHSIKGSSSNIGAPHVAALAGELEGRLARGSFDGADELVARLAAELERARQALIEKVPGPPAP
jgi:HPt (histidine-containing phosphotransfer) domain-containing protein